MLAQRGLAAAFRCNPCLVDQQGVALNWQAPTRERPQNGRCGASAILCWDSVFSFLYYYGNLKWIVVRCLVISVITKMIPNVLQLKIQVWIICCYSREKSGSFWTFKIFQKNHLSGSLQKTPELINSQGMFVSKSNGIQSQNGSKWCFLPKKMQGESIFLSKSIVDRKSVV